MLRRTFQVSVVIACWNSAAHLPRCLESLSAQSHRDFEVLLIDNGSTDDAAVGLEGKYPGLNLRVERLASNLGFAAANNIGARLARGRWLALLNADAFPAPDWLEKLLNAARESPPNSFFASRQIQANQPGLLLDGEGDIYHVSGMAWRRNYNLPVYSTRGYAEVFSACGAAALYPCREFLDAGGFDEDYFAYLEDVDLGFRLRLRGSKCIFVPDALVHHIGSASTSRTNDFVVYHGHRNLVWTYVKNMPSLLFWLYLPLHLMANLISLAYFSLRGQGRVIWRAKLDALRGLSLVLRKRRAIQPTRRVSIGQVHRSMNRNLLGPYLALLERRHYLGRVYEQ